MNIFVDTIKYKINGLSVNTQDFSQYLSNNGIKNYDESVEHKKSNYKSSIYKRVSNECRDFIKGSANYFTIFKTFVDGKNKNIFFEFYGLKSYCQCIDELRDNVIKLFHQWIGENELVTQVSISAIDIAFDFDNIHPIDILFERKNTQGKEPKLNIFPKLKNFFDTSTYYLYDKEFLEYKVNSNYSQKELEEYYNKTFEYGIEDDYVYSNFMNYEKQLSHFKWMSDILHKDVNSFGYIINNKYMPISHYKKPVDKLLNNMKKKYGKKPHDKLFSNNKNFFLNINNYYKEGIYYKEEEHKNGIMKKLFVDSHEYSKKQQLYIFTHDLVKEQIIYPIKPKKSFQIILYDKKNKIDKKYVLNTKLEFNNLSRVEFKINGITNIDKDITKKIDLINITVHNIKQNINSEDVKKIIENYLIRM